MSDTDYRIVESEYGFEPQIQYTTGEGKQTWFPLNAKGYWLEPDAFSYGAITMHNFFNRIVAEAAIERAKLINTDKPIITDSAGDQK